MNSGRASLPPWTPSRLCFGLNRDTLISVQTRKRSIDSSDSPNSKEKTKFNDGIPLPHTVSHFAHLYRLGLRCSTKCRFPHPSRSLSRTRCKGEMKSDAKGQRQTGTRSAWPFARGHRLELGTDEGSLRLGSARGIPF